MIGYGKKEAKNKVNLTKIGSSIKRILEKKEADGDFVGSVYQKDCSDNYYLPERALFTLPVKFVNLLYNYAHNLSEGNEKDKVSIHQALEHFLTNMVKSEEILGFIPQRPEESDNQSRRLHTAVAFQINHQGVELSKAQKRAQEIIKEKKPELDALVQAAIRTGKIMYEERRRKEGAA